MPIPVYTYKVVVSLSDIDENKHANNQCYLRWMNEAAIAHSEANGWTAQRLLELGQNWFARRHTIEYLAQATEGDQLEVKTWIYDWKTVRSLRKYRFTRLSDGVIVAEAETLWAFVNLETGRPVRIPQIVADSFIIVGELESPKKTAS